MTQLPPAGCTEIPPRVTDGETELARAQRLTDMAWTTVAYCDTSSWASKVSRAVDRAGHGDHGGWFTSPEKYIHCKCSTAQLFPLYTVTKDPDDQPASVPAHLDPAVLVPDFDVPERAA